MTSDNCDISRTAEKQILDGSSQAILAHCSASWPHKVYTHIESDECHIMTRSTIEDASSIASFRFQPASMSLRLRNGILLWPPTKAQYSFASSTISASTRQIDLLVRLVAHSISSRSHLYRTCSHASDYTSQASSFSYGLSPSH